ncbi:MAG: hypothetical protein Q9225_006334 [Loekoesia sp. 1 TL-2023]
MSVSPTSQTFPFLRLPSELRVQVYNYILPAQAKISRPRPDLEESQHQWALAKVCRHIRNEFLSTFYSRVPLIVDLSDGDRAKSYEAYHDWIVTLDENLAALVRYLVIDAEIEVERESQWETPSLRRDLGWYVVRRRFETIRLLVRYDGVRGKSKVRICSRGRRKEMIPRTGLEKIEGVARRRPDRAFSKQTTAVFIDIGKLVANIKMEVYGARRESGTRSGKESIKWLVETMWRYRSMDVKGGDIGSGVRVSVEEEEYESDDGFEQVVNTV